MEEQNDRQATKERERPDREMNNNKKKRQQIVLLMELQWCRENKSSDVQKEFRMKISNFNSFRVKLKCHRKWHFIH